jgi:hypothetical protein
VKKVDFCVEFTKHSSFQSATLRTEPVATMNVLELSTSCQAAIQTSVLGWAFRLGTFTSPKKLQGNLQCLSPVSYFTCG